MPFDRVRFFSAGECTQFGYLAARAEHGLARFKNVFVHLEHPAHGVSIIDAGYSPRFFDATRPMPQRLYRWTTPVHLDAHEHAAAILDAHGLQSDAVGELFISHFHGDHVAGLDHFPSARFVYRREALDSLLRRNAWSQVRHGFLAALLPRDFTERGNAIDDDAFVAGSEPFEEFRIIDYWGDGDLLLIDLPGHSPGHTGFAIRTKSKQFLYIADACWDVDAMLVGRELPLPSRKMQHSYVNYLTTQDKLRRFAKRDDWTMLATHCPRTQRHVERD
ncbi:MAG TPA: MBL fold metallo-hydrolase [Thermoanaerobaculia bacterium]|nr:MBL fold metallo-hydrolase [Thermoanaerobaculia bacterium]